MAYSMENGGLTVARDLYNYPAGTVQYQRTTARGQRALRLKVYKRFFPGLSFPTVLYYFLKEMLITVSAG